jgi:hypothetical protein
MWRVRIAVPGAALLAAVVLALAPTRASPADATLKLTVTSDETGWLSLVVRGARDGPVVLRELIDGGSRAIANVTLRDGAAERGRATRWRCRRRTRRFEARAPGPAGPTATATITTPSCADRLRMIVVPARVRPGQEVSVRVSDTWRLGEISAKVCAGRGDAASPCRRVTLPPGVRTRRAHMHLRRTGRRTIVLRSAFGQRLATAVEVRTDAQLRVLVSGDSMTFGVFEALAGDLGDRGAVQGDPHPGRGITTPGGFLDWPAHARRVARTARPDVTIVFLGAADAGYPLTAGSGQAVPCCDPAWVALYAGIVRGMMSSYLRDGRGLVYWVLLPAPRSAQKAKVFDAENDAIGQAGRDLDGVRVITRVARVLAPGDRFRETITFHGREVVVREADGVHLTSDGVRVASGIVEEALREDRLVP